MVVITIDIDWAPDEVINDTLTILNSYNIPATIFATHETDIILNKNGCEVSIHPNFTTFDFDSHVKQLLNIFPEAMGTRSHTFFDTYKLQPIYKKFCLKYQSNVIMHRQENIRPYFVSPWVVEFPIFFADNVQLMFSQYHTNDVQRFFEIPGMKVFCFHPIHIFLNTAKLEDYELAKIYYHDPKKLAQFRQTKLLGTRDIFISLLQYINDSSMRPSCLSDVYFNFVRSA